MSNNWSFGEKFQPVRRVPVLKQYKFLGTFPSNISEIALSYDSLFDRILKFGSSVGSFSIKLFQKK